MNNFKHPSGLSNSKSLLSSVKRILKHQEAIKTIKGENFNVFSILKMESRENDTHSAFLAELLNPEGSHLMKTAFLSCFLQEINYKETFDVHTAKLKTEFYTGERDDIKKTGGRIDIYIEDANCNSISIENKIYADDQDTQIERYVNHNKDRNTVYYLTLNGIEPNSNSRGDLTENKEYFSISYRDTIIDWLMTCLKEASEQPILRETIKQYIILLKKLTNQLSDDIMNKEIQDLIENNYNAAKAIEGNIWKTELLAVQNLLKEVKDDLENELKDGWKISLDEDLNVSWSGLSIEHSSWNGIKIKVEGQSSMIKNNTVYGLVAPKLKYDREVLKTKFDNTELFNQGFKESKFWPYYREIFSLSNQSEMEKLFDSDKRKEFIKEIVGKLIKMANVCEGALNSISKLQLNT